MSTVCSIYMRSLTISSIYKYLSYLFRFQMGSHQWERFHLCIFHDRTCMNVGTNQTSNAKHQTLTYIIKSHALHISLAICSILPRSSSSKLGKSTIWVGIEPVNALFATWIVTKYQSVRQHTNNIALSNYQLYTFIFTYIHIYMCVWVGIISYQVSTSSSCPVIQTPNA